MEVAAYRIVQEAITNVGRHAKARTCSVSLTIDEDADTLCLEVRDDGRGMGENRGMGVGLTSMRERAEELGGSFTVNALPGGGTIVRAGLPLPERAEVGSIRVLVADDHPVFRYGMRAILGAEPDTEIAGEATDGEEAVTLAAELGPDVVLMDINMPGVNGIEATRRILEASPQTGVLMLTMFEDDASVFVAMRAGARGYVLKGADGERRP